MNNVISIRLPINNWRCGRLNGCVGDGAAVAARSTVRWSVDRCRSTHTTTARDATSTTAADNRRHRTVVFRQTRHSREVRGCRQPAGDESDEHRPTLQQCQCLTAMNVPCSRFAVLRRSHIVKSLVASNCGILLQFGRWYNISIDVSGEMVKTHFRSNTR